VSESRCGATDNTGLHKFLLMGILTLENKSLILVTSVRVDNAFDFSPVEVPGSKQSPVEVLWHTVTHRRGSEGETDEWSG